MRVVGALLWLVLISGCAQPITPSAPASTPTSTTRPTAATGGATISVVDGDPYVAAGLRIIQLAGTPCLRDKEVEPDVAVDELERAAAELTSAEGMIAAGRAYIGSLTSAAIAFGGAEVLQSRAGGRAVVIGRALDVPDVLDGARIGYLLVAVTLRDGRTAWVRTGAYVTSIRCPEGSG
jgi:hypothetical protein